MKHLAKVFAAVCLLTYQAGAAEFSVVNTNDAGAGSLRQAILDANTNPGADVITFAITNASRSIRPTNALPAITETVTIDATTQPGFTTAPIVELNGQSAGTGADGLRLWAGEGVVRGLVINRFNGDGIEIATNGNCVIEGCWLGLGLDGVTDQGNTGNGIFITNAPNNRIGGTNALQRNAISGNTQQGILVAGTNSSGTVIIGNHVGLNALGNNSVGNSQNGIYLLISASNRIGGIGAGQRNLIGGNGASGVRIEGTNAYVNVIAGNFIGLDVSGATNRANGQNGVWLMNAPSNMVGGAVFEARNTIAGNSGAGVRLDGAGTRANLIFGNYLGTDVSGLLARGNGAEGINLLNNASGNRLGGINPGEANLILNNAGDGLWLQSGTNNSARGNVIYNNGGLALDLGSNGVLANDAGDPDTGANNQQNYPILTTASNVPGLVVIAGVLNSRPATAYALDFYVNQIADPSTNGEAQVYLGATNIVTGADSNANFLVSFATNLMGRHVTAIATDPDGNTSEFSPVVFAQSTLAPLTLTVTTTNDAGLGSLRQALLDANSSPANGNHVIRFDLPGTGVRTIAPVSALPTVLEPVTINGFSQSGASANTLTNGNNAAWLVKLDGASAGTTDGLRFTNSGNVVRGLILARFGGAAIAFFNSHSNIVAGNCLGLSETGADQGNSGDGVFILNGRNNLVGGPTAADRNIISGNTGDGIELQGTGAMANVVQGNYIGTGFQGANFVRNANGILINGAPGNAIGGASPGAGNLISGNSQEGIELTGANATNNVILGNWIGTDVTGTLGVGNQSHGIYFSSSARLNRVGGVADGEANAIAFNTGDGIYVQQGTNNTLRANRIFSNNGLGIDLDTDGVTANDPGDADGNANLRQNYPVITNAFITASGTLVEGLLNSQPNTPFTIDFYSNLIPDNSTNGEGQFYLGSTAVGTSADSNAFFSLTLPSVATGRFLSATATDTNGNTSEFSLSYRATSTLPSARFVVTTTNDAGTGSLRQAILDSNASATSTNNVIAFNIGETGTVVIATASALPPLREPVIIDGYTQPGASANTLSNGNNAVIKVRLDGASAGSGVDGFKTSIGGSVIRGLCITRFNSDGIELSTNGNNVVEGCFIGLAPDGATPLGNNGSGTYVNGTAANVIGGTNPAARNVISANNSHGVNIQGLAAVGNLVVGNFIGTDATGLAALGNGSDGARLDNAPGNQVGNGTPSGANWISGNNNDGVELTGANATNNLVRGNQIGLSAASGSLGNGAHGINFASSARFNVIGGTNDGAGNRIAFNGNLGVRLGAGTNNAVRGNAIVGNANLGLDLAGDGPTENDDLDGDGGINRLQNYPTLTSGTIHTNRTEVGGTLNSAANSAFHLDFFASLVGDSSGFGEGEQFLGTITVNTDPAGNASFNASFPGRAVGRFLTATATDTNGNTSEFSASFAAGSTLPPVTLVVNNTNDSGPGSLRQALEDAGLYPSLGQNRIRFEIPGPGPHTIAPLHQLPPPGEAVFIDGYSQPGASPNTLSNGNNAVIQIILDGISNQDFAPDGLRLTNGNNTVRGLNIIRWSSDAIQITGGGSNQVAGCWIGLGLDGTDRYNNGGVYISSAGNEVGGLAPADRNVIAYIHNDAIRISGEPASNNIVRGNYLGMSPDGTQVAPNWVTGVRIEEAPGNLVGGTQPGARNLVSGNFGFGVAITGPGSSGNTVQGNYIGLDASGTLLRGNGQGGVNLTGPNNLVGGLTPAARNLITASSSRDALVSYGPEATNNVIQGNYFGTDVTGTLAFSNQISINIYSANNNLVGGTLPGAGNLIANSIIAGVQVYDGRGNAIRGNVIRNTQGTSFYPGLGIDLDGEGVTTNDIDDLDAGANLRQNFPIITNAVSTATNITIAGRLLSAPNQTFFLDFFANPLCDPSGHGEGNQFLGWAAVNTDGSGAGGFNVSFPVLALGRAITATATDTNGNTSEFSACFEAASTLPPRTYYVTTTNDSGPGSLRQALLDAQAYIASTNNLIAFNLTNAPGLVKAARQPRRENGNDFEKFVRLFAGLPPINQPVIIDGFTQPGASPNTLAVGDNAIRPLVLDGTAAGPNTDGLVINAPGTIIRGLNIRGFRNGILVQEGREVRIQGNSVSGNRFSGIDVQDTGGAFFGGPLPALRNAIFDNGGAGIEINGPQSTGIQIQGNIIGLNSQLQTGVGNRDNGIRINDGGGIVIGGSLPLAGNTISGNTENGVQIIGGKRVSIFGNSIFNNGGSGISLGFFGDVPNDPGDADTGPNDLLNFPILTGATLNANDVNVQGTYNSAPSSIFQLHVYLSSECDFSGMGEGETYLGSAPIATGPDGTVNFNVTIPTPGQLLFGKVVTATMMDAEGNTSRFGDCLTPLANRPPRTFTVTRDADDGAGSLREAIHLANNYPAAGNNIINFNLPAPGPFVIFPQSPLPNLLNPVTIDGFTQPGASPNTLASGNNAVLPIRLDGFNLPGFFESGLTVKANNSIIRGLDITRFSGGGITVDDASGVQISGNFIGLAPGATGLGNGSGIHLNGANNQVGGTLPGLRNVISGNLDYGIVISGNNGTGNRIQGNFIGTGLDGLSGLGNGDSGIILLEPNNIIGGAVPGAFNVIGGNGDDGIELFDNTASGTLIQGNFIGTDVSQTLDLGNRRNGISVRGFNNQIGGTQAGAGNVIANNDSFGLALFGGNGHTFLGNPIFGNATGPLFRAFGVNQGVNPPALSMVFNRDGITTIQGTCAGPPNAQVNLDFFATPPGVSGPFDPLGTIPVLIGPTGTGIFDLPLNELVPLGNTVTATGTGPDGSTSALTPPARVILPGSVDVGVFKDYEPFAITPEVPALASAFYILVTNSGPADATNVRITDLLPPGMKSGLVDTPPGVNVIKDGAEGGQVEVVIEQLPANTAKAIAIFVAGDMGGIWTNCAEAVAAEPENNPGNNRDCIFFGQSPPPSAPSVSIANTVSAGTEVHPVSTFTGELFELLPPDLVLDGPMPLVFQRFYASWLKKDGRAVGPLGANWLHNYDLRLVRRGSVIEVVHEQGRIVPFMLQAGTWYLFGRKDIPFRLAQVGDSFVMGDPRSQRLYTFSTNGPLTAIADGRGNTLTLTYGGTNLATVADGLGGVLTFSYDAAGLLTNVTDGTRQIGFRNGNGNLIAARDALGNETSYAYTNAGALTGLLIATTRPEGNVTYQQEYDALGRVIRQVDGGRYTNQIIYGANDTTVVDPFGARRTDAHSPNGELLSFTDAATNTIHLGYDGWQRMSGLTNTQGQSSRIAYHAPSGGPAAITNEDGSVIRFSYIQRQAGPIAFYDLQRVTLPDDTSETFTYDAQGIILRRTDQNGQAHRFSYNARGQMLTATNPTGGVITLTYHPNGMLATSRDSDTGVTQFFYDGQKRLTNVVYPDGSTASSVYDAHGRLAQVADARGSVTRFAYDRNHRLTNMTDAAGQSIRMEYDARDHPVRTTDRLGRAISLGVNPFGILAAVTNRNGHVTRFNFDERRRLASVVDAAGKTWRFAFDNENVLQSVANPLDQAVQRGSHPLGAPTSFTNALGHSTLVQRDAMLRPVAATDGLGRTNSFAYDGRGTVTNAAKPAVGAATYEYTALGSLSRITDLNQRPWSFTYSAMGRMRSVTDPLSRTTTCTNDTRGRLAVVAHPNGDRQTNTYDVAGNLARRQYSGGLDLPFGFDHLNRLTNANEVALAYDPESRIVNTVSSGVNFGAAHDAEGRLTNVTYFNGALTVTYSYDERDRLVRVRDSLTAAQLDFTYDEAGRLTGITRANGRHAIFTHDAAGRVVRLQEGSFLDLRYTLNPASEVTGLEYLSPLEGAGAWSNLQSTLAYDAAHQITNPGYAYDARGRLINAPSQVFGWDAASRLTSIGAVALGYNGLNHLTTRTVAGVTTRYYYNYALHLAPIVAERNESLGQTTRYYIWSPAGELLYSIEAAAGNAVRYYHFDRHGSTMALTDASGQITDSYAYSVYGELLGRTGSSSQPFLYLGELGARYEAAAQLYQLRARYYDPRTARFLSRDPLWPLVRNPANLDPYQYAWQNPLSNIDPTGLVTQWIGEKPLGTPTGTKVNITGMELDLYVVSEQDMQYELARMRQRFANIPEFDRYKYDEGLTGKITWLFGPYSPFVVADWDSWFFHQKHAAFKFRGRIYNYGEFNQYFFGQWAADAGFGPEVYVGGLFIWKGISTLANFWNGNPTISLPSANDLVAATQGYVDTAEQRVADAQGTFNDLTRAGANLLTSMDAPSGGLNQAANAIVDLANIVIPFVERSNPLLRWFHETFAPDQ